MPFLTSWAIEELETVPKRYIEKEPNSYLPRFDELLEILKPKMQQYRSHAEQQYRATRSEFKAVKQKESEDLRDYSRKVPQLADIAFPEKSLRERTRYKRSIYRRTF